MDKNLEQFISLTKHFNYKDYDFNVKWVKILFGLINQKIKFDKYEHTYTFIKNHKKLTSATTFIKWDAKPFNAYEISEQISKNVNSKYYNIDPKIIRQNWNLNTMRANNKHAEIEKWIKKEIDNYYLDDVLRNKYGLNPDYLLAEILLYNIEYGLAGMADIIKWNIYNNNDIINIEFSILDIKTFSEVTPDRIVSYSRQIFLYCIMLNEALKTMNEIFKDNGINNIEFKVKPGVVIHLQPMQELTQRPDILDMKSYLEPRLLKLDRDELINIKNRLLSLKEEEI